MREQINQIIDFDIYSVQTHSELNKFKASLIKLSNTLENNPKIQKDNDLIPVMNVVVKNLIANINKSIDENLDIIKIRHYIHNKLKTIRKIMVLFTKEEVIVTLTKDEALVLHDLLIRNNDDETLINTVDKAEQIVLWNLEAALESEDKFDERGEVNLKMEDLLKNAKERISRNYD